MAARRPAGRLQQSGKRCWLALCTVQGGRGSEKSSNSGYLLKVKPTDLAEGLHARCEGKRELKNDP